MPPSDGGGAHGRGNGQNQRSSWNPMRGFRQQRYPQNNAPSHGGYQQTGPGYFDKTPVGTVARKGTSRGIVSNRMTIPAGAVDKKGILHMTVSNWTCGAVVAMTVAPVGATVFVARRASILPISSLHGLCQPVGIAARVATMLIFAIIRPFICRVHVVKMDWWRIGAGFVDKPCICQSTV